MWQRTPEVLKKLLELQQAGTLRQSAHAVIAFDLQVVEDKYDFERMTSTFKWGQSTWQIPYDEFELCNACCHKAHKPCFLCERARGTFGLAWVPIRRVRPEKLGYTHGTAPAAAEQE